MVSKMVQNYKKQTFTINKKKLFNILLIQIKYKKPQT